MLRQAEMRRATLIFVFLLVLTCLTRIGNGQVTFSRNWNPGKRSPAVSGEENCLANAKSTAIACRVLMNELRQLSACEARVVAQFLRTQDDVGSDQAIFSGTS